MMLSRRNLLNAGLVFVTVWMLGLLSGCASPAPKMASVANGVKRVDLGSATITMVSDGHGSRALDANFVRNAPLAEVQMALREAGLPEDRLEEYKKLHKGGYKALKVMERQLQLTPYLVGDQFSIADVALYAYTHVAQEGGFDLDAYPGVQAWLQRVASHPKYVAMLD